MATVRKKIIIIEDDPNFRICIKDALNSTDDFQLVAETEPGLKAIEVFKRVEADLIILDLNLPAFKGYELLREAKKTNAKVLVLSIYDKEDVVKTAFELGADGYCVRELPNLLIRAIYEALEDKHPVFVHGSNTINQP